MIDIAIQAALQAAKEILKIYQKDFEVLSKEDNSPLTLADNNAHRVIVDILASTGLPILSEEGDIIPFDQRKQWSRFWMVDPLDGTKEFVHRNGEFTVNIALIENGYPVMGVVYSPVLKKLYFAERKMGAYMIKVGTGSSYHESWLKPENKLPKHTPEIFTIVGSKSHYSTETEEFVNHIKSVQGEVNFISMGSSLKLCLVAEGAAHVYPRLAPTMEWDTAAGDAICRAAGKQVIEYKSDTPLQYNKENLLNPYFVVQ